jgi:DNA modification methylase
MPSFRVGSCRSDLPTKTKPCSVLKCPTFAEDKVTLANADCLYVLKNMQDKTAALVVIDPPYGGHTHNQQGWDVAWSDEEWKDILRETYRVLIPGGHVVVFSSGKSTIDINSAYIGAHKQLFGK